MYFVNESACKSHCHYTVIADYGLMHSIYYRLPSVSYLNVWVHGITIVWVRVIERWSKFPSFERCFECARRTQLLHHRLSETKKTHLQQRGCVLRSWEPWRNLRDIFFVKLQINTRIVTTVITIFDTNLLIIALFTRLLIWNEMQVGEALFILFQWRSTDKTH